MKTRSKYNKGIRKPLERVSIIIDMIKRGVRDTDIAKKVDCTRQNVNYTRIKYHLKQYFPPGRIRQYHRCAVYGTECNGPNVGRFCRKHWNDFNTGRVNWKGKFIRDKICRGRKKKFYGCIIKECINLNAGRFCTVHWRDYYNKKIDIFGIINQSR